MASNVGLDVDAEAIPILDETRQLCQRFSLNPLGVIASGALLIAVAEDSTPAVCKALQEIDVPVAPIARAVPVRVVEGLEVIDVAQGK